MITNKQIEEAARDYATENPLYIEDQMGDMIDGKEELSDSFKAGVHWAIEQFLNDLWHDAKEEPKDGQEILVEIKPKSRVFRLVQTNMSHTEFTTAFDTITWIDNWKEYCNRANLTRWLYLDDLEEGKK